MGENRVLFTFRDEIDMERVIANGPWSFDKFLIILQRIEDDDQIAQIKFRHISLWVQIHNMPVRHLTEEAGWKIGATLGTVERVGTEDERRGGGNYVRIRVRMDAQKPLCRGRKIGLDGKREMLVSFKYERLPNFCYWCGLITHGKSDCDLWLQSQETL